ncbi:MAG: PDZ domain-containing protein [Myxococcales bacterium]|nr:PDZ domain-containing protein [Myxococcales bacterium]
MSVPGVRRSRVLIALTLGAVMVCLLLLWAEHADRAPSGKPRQARLPTMAPRADTGHAKPAPQRAENDFATVQCTVTGSGGAQVPTGQLRATAVEADDVEPGTIRTALAHGAEMTLTLPPGRWTLAWGFGRMPVGMPLGTVDLLDGDIFHCAVSPQGVPISGVVLDTAGHPLAGVRLGGCGRSPKTDADGQFSFTVPFAALRGAEHTCSLRARWEDGMLSRYSDGATVSALTPGPFSLSLDASPVAGMGIALDGREDGIYVANVHPGTPAEDADLRAGDRILEVDGHETTGMSVMDFIPYGVGKEGSTVVLQLDRDGEDVRKSFRRERIVKVDTGD